jgi:hypothetical protein
LLKGERTRDDDIEALTEMDFAVAIKLATIETA